MKKAFTILEMLVVLAIIALLFLLTLPNIAQKQKIINRKGCDALVEVVNGQIVLFEVENRTKPNSIQQLIDEGYLKESQSVCPDGEKIEIYDGQASIQ